MYFELWNISINIHDTYFAALMVDFEVKWLDLLCPKKTNKKTKANRRDIFTAEQKRFIVKVFDRNFLPASVRREFLHFKIAEREASKLHVHVSSSVNLSFEQNDSVLRKKRTAGCESVKRSPEKI